MSGPSTVEHVITRQCAGAELGTSVNYLQACNELDGISRRHLRRLIRAGKLVRVDGQRRVTRESLNREIERRKADMKADIRDISARSTPKERTSSLPKETEMLDSEQDMLLRFPMRVNSLSLKPLARLVSIPAAAAMTGITDDAMRRAVAADQVPVVIVGCRQKIDVSVLKSWARGELAGGAK